MNKQIEVTTYNSALDGNDEETVTIVPSKVEVCDRCNGEGKHTNPTIDGNGITASEMDEYCHDEPDFRENYFAGVYDITCEECKGLRVVRVIDWETFEATMPEIAAAHSADLEDQHNSYLENQAELRMGA